MRGAGSRAVAFARSVVLLAALVVGAPWVLMAAARARFGGRAPLHGVPSPTEWDADRVWSALTDRLTEQTVADVVIRLSLLVAWTAIVVLVLTIVAEVVHMVRHDGLPMPEIRGLALSQSAARVIASGLLVIVPMFGSPSRAIARDGSVLVPEQRPSATVVVHAATPDGTPAGHRVSVDDAAPPTRSVADGAATAENPAGEYVVRAGDSIYGISERLAGPDPGQVAAYAERLIDLNLGREMSDGQRFTNAAFIDVGWVLRLPAGPSDAAAVAPAVDAEDDAHDDAVHVVERGESLWSIADEELGDAERWPEIYEANRGRAFDDGRVLRDPDLIQPGWDLDIPTAPAAAVDDVVEPGEPAAPAADAAPADEREAGDDVPPTSDTVTGVAVPSDAPARPDNVWIARAGAGSGVDGRDDGTRDGASAEPESIDVVVDAATDPRAATPSPAPPVGVAGAESERNASEAPRLLTFGRAAMLSAGVLTLLAVRRRAQLRRARPRTRLPAPSPIAAVTERTLRATDPGERFERVDIAIRAAAPALIEHGQRVLAVLVGADGDVELRATGRVSLPPPWHGQAATWHLAAATPIELLAADARRVGAPCPTLVQLGRALEGRDVYVDLEALEAVEVGGPGDQADAVVSAIATTLAGSVLAEVTTLIGVGVADDAFLGHRLHVPARDPQRAFEAAADAIGSTAAMSTPTFELRARVTSGEAWEPAVVLVGAAAGTVTPPRSRTGLAVVSASPIHGPSSRLAPDGDAWLLLPEGIRLVPVGLSPDDVAAIADLVTVTEPPAVTSPPAQPVDDATILTDPDEVVIAAPDDDATLIVPTDRGEPLDDAAGSVAAAVEPAAEPEWALMVRLIGPIDVVSDSGESVGFERSKTRELVAWLATHRDRSTRQNARTALWELGVRDATFNNVVSEARRSLARLVEPPAGEEWVGRTMTEALPLHDLVVTDADLLEHALDIALLQPPAQAIATLTPAVERVAGMPFEGTSFLWPDAEGLTSNLVLLATTAATELAAHCLSVGDIDGVFRATGRGLQVLRGHEELIGLRMRAHARAGDHAGVRQEWESYERVITADPWSDGEPSPKLVELRRELLNPWR